MSESIQSPNTITTPSETTSATTTPASQVETQAVPEIKSPVPVSSQFAALAKKEKAIVAKQKEIQAREQSFAERETKYKEMESKYIDFETQKTSAKQNPLKYLEATGLTYEDIVQAQLSSISEDPELAVIKQQLNDFKKDKETQDLKALEAQRSQAQQEEEKNQREFNSNVTSQIQNAGDEFELINQYGQYALVTAAMKQALEDNSLNLTVKEAAQLVENYLETEIEKEFSKVQSLKKFQAKHKPAEVKPTDTKSEGVGKSGYKPRSPSLNNSMSPTSSTVQKKVSANEGYARAIAKLQGRG